MFEIIACISLAVCIILIIFIHIQWQLISALWTKVENIEDNIKFDKELKDTDEFISKTQRFLSRIKGE